MMRPEGAERLTGFVVGGISPFGQKRRVPALVEQTALAYPLVYINAAQRGLQVRMAPGDAARTLGAITARIAI
ncbi:MAG TPA: YbaK/EbsC family protein [Caulobacteraceae bacterium]|jgi:Cys-tRNA(Pro)/Cys-tRNA(Cys) deacylase|nr:YbaK/EbsC family protein [Caulobacteraceae bacterium]